jgi:gliding motility-associated-like protein
LTGATIGTGTTLNGVAFNLGTTTVTWTVTDGSGNISTCTFDVVVTDDQLPVISSCGGLGTELVTVDLAACTYTVSGTGWDATATDNCTVSTIEYTLTGATTGTGTTLNGVAFNLGTTTVTWTVTDGSGNISTCTFDVVVTDDQLPAISSCGATGTQNVVVDLAACTYTVSGTGWDATATDNCTVSTIEYTLTGATTGTGTTLDGVSFNLGTTTVTWTVTDGSGNISTCTFDVVVTDDQLPAISSCGATGTQNVVADGGLCYYTQSGTGWDATATDNCTVSTIEYTLTGATTGTGTTLNGVSFNLGTTTVTWTVTDGSGNISTCTFDVVVTDDQLPAITSCGPSSDQTVNADFGVCTYTYSGTGWNATATDNCTVSTIEYTLSGATTGTGTTLNGVSFNLGVTNVLWTVTDGSGNASTCSYTVTVLDDQLPSILSCGAAGTQNVSTDPGVCTYTVSGTGWDATADDNCSIATIEYTLSGATIGSGSTLDGVTFAQGVTTVLWTATDGSGNEVTCTFNVVVEDTEVPSIIGCVSDISVNNDNGDCGSIVTWTPPTYTDNCGASMVSTHNPGDFFPVGTTTVTYTVTDNAENVSICTFDVIVTDSELPQLSCNANIASCDSFVVFNVPTVSDNCGIASLTQTAGLPSGSFYPVGTTTVTYEAIDVHGNVNTCSFDVTIHPTPELSTSSTDVSCNGFGDGEIDLTVTSGTAPFTYNWSNGGSSEDLTNLQPGVYGVTVTDVFGCSASTTDTIAQPDLLLLSKEVDNVSCYGGNDGAIDLTISGGVTPYTFTWDTGASTEDLNSLTAGNYSVLVEDANGCTVTDATVINQPDSITIQLVVTDATCNAPNGSINVQVTGGISPYDYSWSNGATTANLSNVVGGTYTLTVTDENGCVATVTDSVGTTSNIGGYVYATDVLCFGGNTGTAIAVIETGNAPFNYTWSTGDTTNLINNLSAGTYSVYVQDAFGCEITIDFEVYQPDSLIVELYSPEPLDGYNVSIYEGADGSIQSDVYGGTGSVTYIWSNGSTTPNIGGLSAGSYSVIVTDENGCTATAGISLNQPRILEMPEGLSPNGDGDNDYFVIRGIDAYPNNELIIYNRWGNVVYQQSGYNNEWQGVNNKGEPLPDGTYFAIFKPTGDGTAEPLTGYVDLRRSR